MRATSSWSLTLSLSKGEGQVVACRPATPPVPRRRWRISAISSLFRHGGNIRQLNCADTFLLLNSRHRPLHSGDPYCFPLTSDVECAKFVTNFWNKTFVPIQRCFDNGIVRRFFRFLRTPPPTISNARFCDGFRGSIRHRISQPIFVFEFSYPLPPSILFSSTFTRHSTRIDGGGTRYDVVQVNDDHDFVRNNFRVFRGACRDTAEADID
jgi:hypothetical protein